MNSDRPPRDIFDLLEQHEAKRLQTMVANIEDDIANGRVDRHAQVRISYNWYASDPDPSPRTFNRYEVDRLASALFDLSLKARIVYYEKRHLGSMDTEVFSYDFYVVDLDDVHSATNITPDVVDAIVHILTCHLPLPGEETSYDGIPGTIDRRPSTML